MKAKVKAEPTRTSACAPSRRSKAREIADILRTKVEPDDGRAGHARRRSAAARAAARAW